MIRRMVPGMVNDGVNRAKQYTDSSVKGLADSIENGYRYEVTYLRTVGNGPVLEVSTEIPPRTPSIGEYCQAHVRDDIYIRGRVTEVRHNTARDQDGTILSRIWVMIDESQAMDDADQMP
jgi:hypothetical protein